MDSETFTVSASRTEVLHVPLTGQVANSDPQSATSLDPNHLTYIRRIIMKDRVRDILTWTGMFLLGAVFAICIVLAVESSKR